MASNTERVEPTAQLEWVDEPPPRKRSTSGKWAPVAEQLKANPGKWAKVQTGSTSGGSFASMVRHAKTAAFAPAGAFEAVTRSAGKDDRGRDLADLYVRFVGEKQEHAGK